MAIDNDEEIQELERQLREMRQEPGEWYKIGYSSENQEWAIRTYAAELGFENLRGFWKYLESQEWDYYDVLRYVSP